MSDVELPEDDDDLDDEDDVTTPGKKTPRPPSTWDRDLGAAVGACLAERGWDYSDFVRNVWPAHPGERWNKNRIGRLIRGERRISFAELADVAAAIGISRLELLARGGYIDLPKSEVKDWLAVDTTILLEDRRSFLRQYELAQRAKLEHDRQHGRG